MRLLSRLMVLSALSLFPLYVIAQDAAPPVTDAAAAPAPDDAAGGNRRQRGDTRADGTPRRSFDPSQMLDNMRKRLEVTDDAEWTLISSRLTTVFQLRMAGLGGMRMREGGGNGGTGSTRPGVAEAQALRTAIDNKLPDAEIKARLTRFREVRKETQAKLEKAQEDLRAVLSVRQEALLVMMGMLN